MINSVDVLPDGKILINNIVKFWFDEDFKPQAEFDRNIINEMEAVSLIQEYVKKLNLKKS